MHTKRVVLEIKLKRLRTGGVPKETPKTHKKKAFLLKSTRCSLLLSLAGDLCCTIIAANLLWSSGVERVNEVGLHGLVDEEEEGGHGDQQEQLYPHRKATPRRFALDGGGRHCSGC